MSMLGESGPPQSVGEAKAERVTVSRFDGIGRSFVCILWNKDQRRGRVLYNMVKAIGQSSLCPREPGL
jgi:hypothetical protein